MKGIIKNILESNEQMSLKIHVLVPETTLTHITSRVRSDEEYPCSLYHRIFQKDIRYKRKDIQCYLGHHRHIKCFVFVINDGEKTPFTNITRRQFVLFISQSSRLLGAVITQQDENNHHIITDANVKDPLFHAYLQGRMLTAAKIIYPCKREDIISLTNKFVESIGWKARLK